ncbi:MAG: B12-binding domain-containing radical SAM protein [Candidatus Bathyarchaeota archaeon]|nr:B12-binding domain-containing radical SAM protein [Candidatus Bathyarchaeota archaeon]MDH5745391.1 B12-binding domain-containing radical SAM protein [Candidatus Bathyarchaeota archaeon]
MKFSFINAGPYEGLDEREARRSIASFPPLGILYLASVLEERGVEVSVLDQPARGFTVDDTVDWIEKENPDILGFSTFSTSGCTAALISSNVKERNPNIVIVLGNHYATFNSERILRKYFSVDITVRGEGEGTVIDLVGCLRNKGKLKKVQGITFRNKKSIISTPARPLIKDLDCLPFPDRKLIDVDYHSVIAGANVAPKKFTSIVSSRGCVYRCRFCSCTQFARSRWRPRSVENTLEELHFLASEGYKQFIFVDDSFTLNKKRVIKLCRSMRKEKISMEWICEGRVDNCSYEMLREIAKAGCKVLYFGIESANQRILNYYNKQTTPKQSENAVRTARKAGIDVIVGSFIVGAPDETKEEIQNTIEFAKKIPIDFPQFNVLGIYPGTDIWNEFKMKELLNTEEHWETGITVSEICPTAVPLNEIKRMIHQAFYDFVRRPSFILKQLARTLKSTYRTQLLANNLTRIGEIRESIRSIT